jgi:gamma-glutamyl phosphate reductase
MKLDSNTLSQLQAHFVKVRDIDITNEFMDAVQKHGTIDSLHEAIAVIREEYRELEDIIFFGSKKGLTVDDAKKEAFQLAVMAIELATLIDGRAKNFTQLK